MTTDMYRLLYSETRSPSAFMTYHQNLTRVTRTGATCGKGTVCPSAEHEFNHDFRLFGVFFINHFIIYLSLNYGFQMQLWNLQILL
jgi:hypothetical protein